MMAQRAAVRIDVRGVVQGVGFRPTVYRIAHENAVTGWVLNDSHGLSIHAEADLSRLNAFVSALQTQPPPGARIASFDWRPAPVEGFATFEIRSSQRHQPPIVMMSPDLPVCGECLGEMKDPSSRRYLYPYINCTACGPRYSIVRSLPYDRSNTTMANWPLCEACQAEYDDPLDRRHHAQPTACNQCGPGYRLHDGGGTVAVGVEAIARAAEMLKEGMILAVKGIGGYHLACSPRDAAAVRRLRERKFRKEKPFALMARDLETAAEITLLSELHCSLLLDRARPIVLAPSRVTFPGVADDTDELGVMLPYTPLHELLFHFGAPNPLVMTSANRCSEPIAYLDDDALQRLNGIADAFLIGERPIARRVEDSVIAVRDGLSTMIRRSRGFTPTAVARLRSNRPILAVGADLKNSLTLVVAGEAICGQHLGDLGDLETDRAFAQTVHDLLAMYGIDRRDLLVAHDAHPEYVSTRFAVHLDCHRRVAVQHHGAHLASIMAERGELDRPVVGIACDGTGYGDDATIWGFEVFTGSVVSGFRRVAHLRPAKLPGGDAAARYPVQAAAGFLADLKVPDLRQPPFNFPERFFRAQVLITKNVRCFTTTSAGRLFDTVAALCGFTREITFEGQAAIWLEHQAHDVRPCPAYPFPDLDYRPLLASVIADRSAGRDVGEISYAFHAAVARALARTAACIARHMSTRHVALSGGVFQNRLLRSLLSDQEGDVGNLSLLYNQSVPSNDGGISLGQAALASVTTQGDREP
jgi:hydrogenase maturation protein HypF